MRLLAPVEVTLTPDEMRWAEAVAKNRTQASIDAGLVNRHGYSGDRLTIDLIGAAGELAFCRVARIPWDASVNTFKRPDALHDIQIRTTEYPSGRLILRMPPHGKDDPQERYVLVTGKPPRLAVQGWLYGYAAEEWWIDSPADRPPAWFIPASELCRRLDELVRIELKPAPAPPPREIAVYRCSVCGGYATSTVDFGKTWQCSKHTLAKPLNQREE